MLNPRWWPKSYRLWVVLKTRRHMYIFYCCYHIFG